MTKPPSTARTPRQPRKSPIRPETRGAQQISGHGAHQRASDRDLALVGPDQIAGQTERDRKYAAGADAGEDSRGEQQPERRRHRAENVGNAQQHQAHDHQPRLAEQIGGRAEHRLNDRKGEGEDGGETGGGRDADAEIVGHMRQHRIERARRQAGRKRRERNDIEGRRQAARCGHGRMPRHQRAAFFGSSASNAIRVFTSASNSRSGTMLGPSDGA